MSTSAVHEILAAARRRAATLERPIVIALDGGSASGKSTIADQLRQEPGVAVVPLDGFFAASIPAARWPNMPPPQRLTLVFAWHRVRAEALEPLLAGRTARWRAFDFVAGQRSDGTYPMAPEPVEVPPAPIILLDGAYTASLALADLVDLAVLVDVPVAERHRRAALREEAAFLENWHELWDATEAYYFDHARPPASFDLVVRNPPYAASDDG